MLAQHKQHILDLFQRAVDKQLATQPGLQLQKPPILTLDRPRDPSHGDIACNIAMQLAKVLERNPRELAQALCDEVLAMATVAGNLVVAAEVAGPGFINLRLSTESRRDVLRQVAREGAQYGRLEQANAVRPTVLLEFVSANPTGPLHVGHGRQGVLGDALASIFDYRGYQVHREFYYNDAGVQIATLATSVQARARGEQPGSAGWPENAYNGDYIADIARDFLAGVTVSASDGDPVTGTGNADDLETIRRFAVAYLRREQDLDLQAFGVRFDQYYLESSLYTEGRVEATVSALVAAGKTYGQDGALWLRTTDYGDDKDRVMKKSDGTYTYFVPDVAYHVSKWERGYTKAINIQGSDHHGTIARVRAGLQALDKGIMPGYPDYLLHKMVTVMRNGEEVKISKRAGSYVTLRDLIEWSSGTDESTDSSLPRDLTRGRDAVRFFLVSRKPDTEFVFDVDLALAQNDENPVYYVQYAHARIHSILANGGVAPSQLHQASLAPLNSPHEMLLIDRISEFGAMLNHALNELAPHHVAFYLRELAGDFHSYYNAERVLVDDMALRLARLALLDALAQTLHNGLAVLGVSAPRRM